MQWSPFLEIFIGAFLLLGAVIGYFTKLGVIRINVIIAIGVFAVLSLLSAFNPPANPGLSVDDLFVAALLSGFAAIPMLIFTTLGRILQRRRKP